MPKKDVNMSRIGSIYTGIATKAPETRAATAAPVATLFIDLIPPHEFCWRELIKPKFTKKDPAIHNSIRDIVYPFDVIKSNSILPNTNMTTGNTECIIADPIISP